MADSEDPAYRSWGWDLVTTKLMVDGFVHDGSGDRCYPLQQDSMIAVPDKFHDSEDPAHRTWGWDLVTTKLMVDGFVHDGSDNKCYPLQQDSSLYVVPDKFHGDLLITLLVHCICMGWF
ncbi:hypothetical protein J6590_077180 [Homalodisca vitripennis]|nr:hypothetical protein J6590_036248 [Homalodisca vitripennis]KAG8329878.1 hypothetical protein J6590_077180 [Homalodisca vitripennis]